MTDPRAFPPPSLAEQARMIEALLFAATAPMTARDLAARLPVGSDVGEALALLRHRYEGAGVRLERSAAGYALRTAPDLAWLMEDRRPQTRRLSRAATETLAIIAWHQPVTRTEIEGMRGVSLARGTLDHLIDLGWVRMGARRETPGRPVTYTVTDGFLDHFGLDSLRDLPGLADLRAAGFVGDATPLAGTPDEEDMGATTGTETP